MGKKYGFKDYFFLILYGFFIGWTVVYALIENVWYLLGLVPAFLCLLMYYTYVYYVLHSSYK